MAVLVITVLGATALVKVDQIVPVPGRLRPIRSTQDLKSTEPGVVSAVLVVEGERVQKNQPLVQLDPVILKGRQRALQEQRGELGLMARAELDRLEGALGEARSEAEGLEKERGILREQIARLQELVDEGGASRFQLLDFIRQLSDVEGRLSRSRLSLERLEAESRQKQAELRQQAAENRASRVETEQRLRRVTIRAPLAGTVLNLKAKPEMVAGGDEVLLQLVPRDNLEAEVFVPNRNLAFVRPGQQAELEVEAYDPSRFGRILSTVQTIATDALPPDATYEYPRFPVTLRLTRQTLESGGRSYPLQAGMAVRANLKLEKRSLLELFFSNIMRSGDAVRTIR